MADYIEITGKDLDSFEKVDTFIDIFGRSALIAAQKEIALQATGDGAAEKIGTKMEKLNPAKDEDSKKYEHLKGLRDRELSKLVEPKKAVYKMPVTSDLDKRLFEKRDVARQYLNHERFDSVVYPLGSPDVLNRSHLRKMNPHLQKHEEEKRLKAEEIKAKQEELKQALKEG